MASADERQEEGPLPGRGRIALPERRAQPARQISRGIDPEKSRDDDHRHRQQHREREIAQRYCIQPIEQGSRLHARHQEDQAFQKVDEQVPKEDSLQPRRGGDQQRPVPTHEQSGGDRRQNARAAEMLRQQERDVGRQQGQRNLDARVARPAPQAQAGPADADSVGDLADDDEGESPRRLGEGEQPAGRRGYGEAVEDQGRCVICEAFAFDDDDEPARHAEAADDRQRRHRVGRRHDGAEHEADRQRHAKQPMRRRRHRAGGENDAAERQKGDRPQVELELAPTHGDAGRIDQRRQHAEQHQLRRQLDPRQTGGERQPDAGDDEKDRGRRVEPPRDDGDERQHREQQQYRLDRRRHGERIFEVAAETGATLTDRSEIRSRGER